MAIVEVSEIISDTRYAKQVKVLGIPVYLTRELNVKTEKEERPVPIGFQQIGDTSLLETEEN